MNQEGGTKGVTRGNLKRRQKVEKLLYFNGGTDTNPAAQGTRTFRLILRGLCEVLDAMIAVGIVRDDTNPLRAADYPLTPGTMQLTPVLNFPDSPKLWTRPVFQDPTLPVNTNNPLPMTIPFSWQIAGEVDEVEIEVIVPLVNYDSTGLTGTLVVEVFTEYEGPWWDVIAIELSQGQVQLTPNSGELEVIGTQNAG
jgi:hypothetical protein